jgi:cytoplasmic iron level regulating protein YaaA (DUF328/UPF0246 family)
MLMIVSPSKTQDFNDSFCAEATQPLLLQDSELLIGELHKLSVSDLGKLMKMSERLASQTYQRINAFEMPFTVENARPAITVFQGDVYSKIAITDYGNEEIDYIKNHLRILSGLYGILRPLDLIQAYRLEMGCRLVTPRGKNLYEFWGEKITAEVNRILASHKEPIFVNLASSEYSRVIKKKRLQGSVLQIDFKERKGDIYRTVAIHAKRARGMMVDFAVKNRVQTVTQLKDFQEAAYTFRPELSKRDQYCFTREM